MNVLEKAEKALDYWDNDSLWSRLIQRDIDANDFEALEFHVKGANDEMHLQETLAKDFEDSLLSGDVTLQVTNWPEVPLPNGFGGDDGAI